MRRLDLLVLSALTAGCATARTPAPQVAPPPPAAGVPALQLEIPPDFQAAIRQGTRTTSGRPGPRYWENFASYTINARIDPAAHRVDGSVRIAYRNNSPDTLQNLQLDLLQNLHAPGAVRFEPAEVTGGVEVRRLSVSGQQLGTEGSGARYAVFGTRLAILPPAPVLPGQSVDIGVDYGFVIPKAGAVGRMGYDGNDLVYMAYWYPQMTVYDDVVGWHPDPFVGNTEFYADFADYRYTLDIPAGWIIVGTGTLENPREVLRPGVLERLRRAETSDQTVAVLSPADFPGNATVATSGRATWRFRADSVRDVAFTMSRNMHWDARRTSVGDRHADGTADYTRIDAIYRPSASRWKQAARFAAESITFLSGFTSLPYPWPHMTAVEGEGIVGGGMEYPMMTLISAYTQQTDEDLFSVIAHELAHMWVPMLLSSDERRYSWLDEGTTEFNENNAHAAFYPSSHPRLDEQQQYLQLANSGEEGELMRRSAYQYSEMAFVIASYSKPAAVLHALRAVLGDSVFLRGYHEFMHRWEYRHPYPWDLWNTFADVSGRDLDWFWYPWYFTTWTLDQAVTGVSAPGDSVRITVENRGRIPMPANLTITLAGGDTLSRTIPVEQWLAGNRTATVTLPAGTRVTRVEIDPGQYFPDVDRGNNVWMGTARAP